MLFKVVKQSIARNCFYIVEKSYYLRRQCCAQKCLLLHQCNPKTFMQASIAKKNLFFESLFLSKCYLLPRYLLFCFLLLRCPGFLIWHVLRKKMSKVYNRIMRILWFVTKKQKQKQKLYPTLLKRKEFIYSCT